MGLLKRLRAEKTPIKVRDRIRFYKNTIAGKYLGEAGFCNAIYFEFGREKFNEIVGMNEGDIIAIAFPELYKFKPNDCGLYWFHKYYWEQRIKLAKKALNEIT